MDVRNKLEEADRAGMLPDILLLNANTNAAMTDTMLIAARARYPNCRAATVARGARYISDVDAASVAAEAVMEFAEALDAETMPDALVVACFGDPGLWCLRDRLPIPVVGMADASCHVACQLGRRFGIVTGGAAWEPMLRNFVVENGLSSRMSGIHTLEQTGDALAADPERALWMIAEKIDTARLDGADVVILGGAGLVGFAERLQSDTKIPLLDSLSCAVSQAVAVSTI
jgi:Asp/Glu/hydantoin racemase